MFIIANVVKFLADLKLGWKDYTLVIGLVCSFVAASVWVNGGGFLLNGEADWFLIDHNSSERSLLSKVICPHRHDAEHYMAREISFIADHIDARFIHACVMNGYAHFLSLSNYLMLGAISVMFWVMAKVVGLDRITSCLLLCVFWTAPPIFMSGGFMRSGHTLAAFLMTALVLFIYYRPLHMSRSAMWIVTAIGSFLLTWSDRQGLFASCCIGLFALIINPSGLRWVICSAIAVAVSCHTFHYLFTGPWLIQQFTPFASVNISSNPMHVAGANKGAGFIKAGLASLAELPGGFTIALSNVRLLIGNVPYAVAAVAIIAAGWLCGRKWLPVLVVALIATFNCVMLRASSVMLWPDCLPSIYYHIISTTALWLILAFCLLKVRPSVARWCLLAMVAGNAFGLSSHVNAFKRGHLVGFISGAPHMRDALNQVAAHKTPPVRWPHSYNTLESCHFTGWQHVMKNPLEYGGKLTAQEFVESSQYLQFVRSEKGLPFGRGGR